MELVGRLVAYSEEEGELRLVFRCSNKVEFDLKVAPAIDRIPPNTLVRAWTERLEDESGYLLKGSVLTHWEAWE